MSETSEAFDLHWDRAFELYERGKLVEAIAEWREASRFDPQDGDVFNNIGRALWDLGQQESAITEWREAVRVEPNSPKQHKSLANVLSASGYSPEALAAVRTAVRLCPEDANLYRLLGYHLAVKAGMSGRKGDKVDYEAARAAFQQALDLAPSDSYALCGLGKIQWWQGKKREAIQTLKAAVAADPNDADAHITLARYQHNTGNLRGMWQTISAILNLPESEEKTQLYASVDRLMRRIKIAFFALTGLGAFLIWMRWKKRE